MFWDEFFVDWTSTHQQATREPLDTEELKLEDYSSFIARLLLFLPIRFYIAPLLNTLLFHGFFWRPDDKEMALFLRLFLCVSRMLFCAHISHRIGPFRNLSNSNDNSWFYSFSSMELNNLLDKDSFYCLLVQIIANGILQTGIQQQKIILPILNCRLCFEKCK